MQKAFAELLWSMKERKKVARNFDKTKLLFSSSTLSIGRSLLCTTKHMLWVYLNVALTEKNIEILSDNIEFPVKLGKLGRTCKHEKKNICQSVWFSKRAKKVEIFWSLIGLIMKTIHIKVEKCWINKNMCWRLRKLLGNLFAGTFQL